jgi:hypothetical protein
MGYLNTYGRKRKISRDWCSSGCSSVQTGPEQGGGGQEEEILSFSSGYCGRSQAAAMGAVRLQ